MSFLGHFPKMILHDICLPLILAQSAPSFISDSSATYMAVFLTWNIQVIDPIILSDVGFNHTAAIELGDRNTLRIVSILLHSLRLVVHLRGGAND